MFYFLLQDTPYFLCSRVLFKIFHQVILSPRTCLHCRTFPNIWSYFSMESFRLLIASCTITLSLFCLLGNVITILAISRDARLKKSVTNYCVMSLSIADIIVGAIVIPFRGYYEFNNREWIFGNMFCDVWYATNISTCTASILNLCMICLDRYVSIFDNLNYESRLSKSRVLIYILIIWSVSISISFPAMFRSWIAEPSDDSKLSSQCMLFLSEKSYMMMTCAVTFYIPLVFMTFFYVKIYLGASKQIKFMERGTKVTKNRRERSFLADPFVK